MIPDSFLKPMQATLNRNVDMSTPARDCARELDGRRVVITSPDLGLNLSFEFDQELVKLNTRDGEGADCVIAGSPLTLLRLAGSDPQAAFRDGSANIDGDALIGQTFQKFLKYARPDWEEELSRLVGDVAAHQLVRGFNSLLDWGRQSSQSMARNAAEYFQEESRDLPSASEAQRFMCEVDDLREQADRVEARIARLEKDDAG